MSAVFKQVVQNIEELSSTEKALIVHYLISLLESKHDEKVWVELFRKRFAELEYGTLENICLEDIKAKKVSEVEGQTASSYIGAAKGLFDSAEDVDKLIFKERDSWSDFPEIDELRANQGRDIARESF